MQCSDSLHSLVLSGVLAPAAENNFTGTWKLNLAKSTGHLSACLKNNLLVISSEVFTGSSTSGLTGKTSLTSKQKTGGCPMPEGFLFSKSTDGQTLILEQPQNVPPLKAVFERQ